LGVVGAHEVDADRRLSRGQAAERGSPAPVGHTIPSRHDRAVGQRATTT
jgi:hypothetical protein